ncbi:MAG: FliM/FliN family flagellar motor switch protein [Hyphomicrobiales bacterium]|nr:FliM/FliN family flagellar motor switch protein [Hyphomicrobiales bacterium]
MDANSEAAPGARINLNAAPIARIPLTMQIVLGSTQMTVREMAQLEPGAVIPLDRKVGEPVEILINGRVIALGDIAVTEGDDPRFAVSITQLVATE